ncbi:hypothetical protein D3C72_1946720 [compost metagenome]
MEKPVSASNSTLAVMPPNSGENTLPDCISRIVGIGSGVSLTLGRRVGSQKDSLISTMTSGLPRWEVPAGSGLTGMRSIASAM